MPALPKSTPKVIDFQRGSGAILSVIRMADNVYLMTTAGVPTGGDGWAGKGSVVIDSTNVDIYMNTGTQASPTWTKKVD